MKKTLLAVAVAAALPAVAFAQTNVTLYGIADASIGFLDSDASGSDATVAVESGTMSTSRFGIRGSEDLGGGLKATFNIESQVKFDTGANVDGSGFWGRRAVVGLAGGFGEVRFGRDYTPGFSAAGTTDVMGYGLYGNWLTYTAQGGISTRVSNGVHYTGTFAGVTLRAMYATGETDDLTADKDVDDAFGISAVYAAGPLTVQGYYQEINGGPINAGPGGTFNSSGDGDSVKQMGIGAGYNFGAFRVTLTYGIADADRGATVTSMQGDKLQGLGLGAGIKVGTGEILAQVMQLEVDNPIAGGRDPDATIFGIAYVHPLSKRTTLYATYGMSRNNTTGRFTVRSGDNAPAVVNAGDDPQAFAVGIRHLF